MTSCDSTAAYELQRLMAHFGDLRGGIGGGAKNDGVSVGGLFFVENDVMICRSQICVLVFASVKGVVRDRFRRVGELLL